MMDAATVISLAMLMAIAAALYSSVGHGGASAYLALMALFSIAPESMRPTALALNLVVATFAAVRFGLKGQMNWRLLIAFAATAVPAAFIGGSVSLAPWIYRPLVGTVLLLAAVRLLWQPERLAVRQDTAAAADRHLAGRSGAWPARRPDWHRRRNFPQSFDHPFRLGTRTQNLGGGRGIHCP